MFELKKKINTECDKNYSLTVIRKQTQADNPVYNLVIKPKH